MTVGLLLIATGRYDCFVPALVESVEKHFFPGFDVKIFLFTDQPFYFYESARIKFKYIKIPHHPFPFATLYRYNHFTQYNDFIISAGCDYLFYCDVDMLFVDTVSIEILPSDTQGLTCVRHPGFWQGGWGSPNTDNRSTAWLAPQDRKVYVAGGFQGGITQHYLEMSKMLAHNIWIDEMNNVMAQWHDETHLNWYINQREVNVLTPEYCFPEAAWAKNLPFKKKLVALDKNHHDIRQKI